MSTEFLKNTFSKVIKDYDSARPRYPKELYDTVTGFAGIGAGANVLEVGVGTGQATDLFLQGEFDFDLLEVSDEQVAFLKQKYGENPNVTVKKDYFEQYETEKKYDLIYSATAFHWVDSWIGYPKAWKMLNAGGTLAVFWHMSSVTYYEGGIFDGLNALKKKYLPQESLGFDTEGIQKVKERRIAQIQSEGCFGEPDVFEYRWIDIYDADRYVTLLNTYSGTQALQEEKDVSGGGKSVYQCKRRKRGVTAACDAVFGEEGKYYFQRSGVGRLLRSCGTKREGLEYNLSGNLFTGEIDGI